MKKKQEETVLGKIYDYTLEDIMGDRFGQYAKDIIQNRAIPDVRDGLKPVQRRILYAMFRDKNTYEKAHKKSATAVGNVMGHYHPHGDSSIYEAMVHMSQWWKLNVILICMVIMVLWMVMDLLLCVIPKQGYLKLVENY